MRLISLPKSPYTNEDFELCLICDFERDLEFWKGTSLFCDLYEELHYENDL
jgi:hypothetical protein